MAVSWSRQLVEHCVEAADDYVPGECEASLLEHPRGCDVRDVRARLDAGKAERSPRARHHGVGQLGRESSTPQWLRHAVKELELMQLRRVVRMEWSQRESRRVKPMGLFGSVFMADVRHWSSRGADAESHG